MTNPDKYMENDEWNTASVSNVTVYINQAGIDTDTERYLAMGSGLAGAATNLQLRTVAVITIDQVNGYTLKTPMTIPANGSWTHTKRTRMKVENFRINVQTAGSELKLVAFTSGKRGD